MSDIKPTCDVYELAEQEFTLDYVAIHAATDIVFAAGVAAGGAAERARIVAVLRGAGMSVRARSIADLIERGDL